MMTRFDYRNVNGQNEYCNNWDNDTYRHAKGIDARWGAGVAQQLDLLSHEWCQWSIKELAALVEAAEAGYEEYVEKYDEFR